VGYSPAAGIIGVEWIRWASTSRAGWAAGIGVAGFGGRLNLGFGDRSAGRRRRVPYVGVGATATPWIPLFPILAVGSLEGGVQFWPADSKGRYLDVGAGAAVLVGRGDRETEFGPVLRLLVGRAF
jgi:hypothetical protein